MQIDFKKQPNGSLLITGPDGSIEVVKPPKGELDDTKMAQFAVDLGKAVMEVMSQPDVEDDSEQAAAPPPKAAAEAKAEDSEKKKAADPDVTVIDDGLGDTEFSNPPGPQGAELPTSGEDLVNTVAFGLFGQKGLDFVKGLQNLSE